ncbi:MAG TPA: sulfatase [Vicinamibacteria bacterium]|nr:sulfatase [Vicinamibacteria bacterium]
MRRRQALRLLAGAAGLPAARAAGQPHAQAGGPNVLFIITDDQRQDTLGVYGNPILRTPHVDRIAAEGARFVQSFVTNALCAPSRATALTGLYSHAHGVVSNGAASSPVFRNQPGLRADQPTWPALLRAAGYHTGLVGKWHLRSWPDMFDQWVAFTAGGYMDPEVTANGVRLKMRGHSDDVAGDQAVAFLQQRPRDRPFCLYLAFKAPHRNWIPPARFQDALSGVEVPVPRTFEDRLEGKPEALRRAEMAVADMPDFRERGVPESLPPEERKRRNLEHLVRNYYRTILAMDENVGRVLEQLEKDGSLARTLVVFTSDNGFFLGEYGLYDKRLMYEPSIRVPLLVRLPGRVRPGLVDETHLVTNVDLFPTLLELAGVPVPAGRHGRSLVPLLEGRQPAWRDAFLYEYFEYPGEHCAMKHRGLRTARWKLIHFFEEPQEWELYDLTADPDETRNLAGRKEHARTLAELRRRLVSLREELGDRDAPGPAPVAPPCRSS